MQKYLTKQNFTLLLQKIPELQPPLSGKFKTQPTVGAHLRMEVASSQTLREIKVFLGPREKSVTSRQKA